MNFLKFSSSCQQFDNSSQCLAPVSFTPVANLPPVSTTLAKMVDKFAAGVVASGGKFATSVVDTGGNLLPVSLIPVVHLDLRISPQIFKKVQNGLNRILWGWGETDS
jgi:hypothetical protein